jgi:uncharacterized membrane protein
MIGLTPFPFRPPRHPDLWLIALGSLVAALLVFLDAPWPVRLPVGLVAVLVLPGYALSLAAFRRGDLDVVERGALSFSLSLALVIALAPIIDRLPGGLGPNSLVVDLSATTLVVTGLAWLRRRQLGPETPGQAHAERPRWQGPGRWAALGVGAIALASLAVLAAILMAPPARATEFFVVGPDGSAATLPSTVDTGAPVSIIVGITSHEVAEQSFRVVVQSVTARLADAGPVTVASGATWTGLVRFSLEQSGDDQEIRILLFRADEPTPFRSLRIALDGVEPAPPPAPSPASTAPLTPAPSP